jgi:hypothetical protein
MGRNREMFPNWGDHPGLEMAGPLSGKETNCQWLRFAEMVQEAETGLERLARRG